MNSDRRTALVAGLFYLATFISSIPAFFLQEPVLTNPDYIISSGSDTQVTMGSFLDLVTAFTGIGTAVALFSVVKRQHEGFALGFVTTRVMEGARPHRRDDPGLAICVLRQQPTDPAAQTETTGMQTIG